jgi:N-acyl-L-homoserine lactone synthetase
MQLRHNVWQACFFKDQRGDARAAALRQFRKKVFVEREGWNLKVVGDEEIDQFDGRGATLCALWRNASLVGGFRSLRCDRPNLSAQVFGHLASYRAFPTDACAWEISRFGTANSCPGASAKLYGLLIEFARRNGALAVTAVVDLQHERLLRRIGLTTNRYGPIDVVGTNRSGEPIKAVLGEIQLSAQSAETLSMLARELEDVEIKDETLVLRPEALSA